MSTPITALAARLALSVEGTIGRRLVLIRNAAAAKAIWPNATITPVGSFAQNTSLNGSDLDVVVHIPDKAYNPANAGEWATELRNELITQRVIRESDAEVLKTARVPILTYTDPKYAVGVDVSFLPNSIKNTEYVRNQLELRPYMRTLLILLKHWLKSRGMNKVFTGGLGSYGLSLSVIGYFNVRKHTKARKVTQEVYEQWLADQDIYHLLVDYLAFWGSQWKYAKMMLEPDEGGIYKKGSGGHIGGKRNSLLAIADPTDPTNNVTDRTTKIFELKRSMKLLKDKLLLAGPDAPEDTILELLRTTGKMFRGSNASRQGKSHPKKVKTTGRDKKVKKVKKAKYTKGAAVAEPPSITGLPLIRWIQ